MRLPKYRKKNQPRFIVLALPFEDIAKNEFLPPAKQKINTGLDPAWEVLGSPSLMLYLGCPDCGQGFQVDYYRTNFFHDGLGTCPACGATGRLSGDRVRQTFERQLRSALARADESNEDEMAHLGRIISRAAILLDPLARVFVIGLKSEQIGHYLTNTARLLEIINRYLNPIPLLITFPPKAEICSNQYLTNYWARAFFIMTPAARPAYDELNSLTGQKLDNPNASIPFMYWMRSGINFPVHFFPPRQARRLINLRDPYWDRDTAGWLSNPTVSILNFKQSDFSAANEWLKTYLPDDNSSRYVAFLGRDKAYYAKQRPLGYHPEISTSRNMDIKTFIPAMRWLSETGLPSIRLGSAVNEALPTDLPATIIDYPIFRRNESSEFMDLFLSANCLFMVSAGSGIDEPARLTGKWALLVNQLVIYAALAYWNCSRMIIMPKQVWSNRKKRFLTYAELTESKAASLNSLARYQERDLTLVDNTAEEILAAVEEMHARVTGTWVVTEEEKKMQRRAVDIMNSIYPESYPRFKFAYSFLKANPYFLE